ncbi:MAG: hypothetical protein HeimC3_28480 [Candidatus Heimdallarchaeota archaeon LC_3]|nr:MAG: hypothetical protein HeimC3_28480 [Candidatus Heimdallarchaeota archaeon LC_3]
MYVTLGKIVKIDGNPVELPKNFIEALITENKEKNAIIVFSSKQGIIRILPTKTAKSYKITIHIDELKDDFIDNVVEILSQCYAKLLYSSGVCFADDQNCFYECFIENPTELKETNPETVDVDDIVGELKHISGVTNVQSNEV